MTGTVVAVDPEVVELSNLQRYILTDDKSEDEVKVDMIKRAMSNTALTVEPIRHHWTANIASDASTVLAAVDSAADRIAIQASLPCQIYNAYTDQHDLGWSRHEIFGSAACLACLYWPTGPGRSRSEEIGELLEKHPARITGYIVSRTPIGEPLPATIQPPRGTTQSELQRWQQSSIIDDIAQRQGIPQSTMTEWRSHTIDELDREGICGGGLIELADTAGAHRQVAVPLAHQSTMAGIMLAVQLIAAHHDDLRAFRPSHNEGRIDLLRALVPYTTERALSDGCFCSDDDFTDRFRSRREYSCDPSPNG